LAASDFRDRGLRPHIVGETMLVAALLGIMSAFLPAYAAARRNIVDALRLVA